MLQLSPWVGYLCYVWCIDLCFNLLTDSNLCPQYDILRCTHTCTHRGPLSALMLHARGL